MEHRAADAVPLHRQRFEPGQQEPQLDPDSPSGQPPPRCRGLFLIMDTMTRG